MMKYLLHVMILCLLLALAGCGAVYVKVPIGTEPLVLDASEWEGEWYSGEAAVVSARVMNREGGILQLSAVDYDAANKPQLVSETVHIRKWKDSLFASAPTTCDGDVPAFFWVRLEKVADRVVFWLPDRRKIKALVEARKLPGTIEKDEDVILGDLNEGHYQILTSEKEGVLYYWDDPGVLMRLIPSKAK
ncbi:MAG TPA: hypothetical protein PK022_05690 [Syntrophales bacterium]|nr:hypothetical protein [Syntrophales bacterium]